jgi:hypothetical protein
MLLGIRVQRSSVTPVEEKLSLKRNFTYSDQLSVIFHLALLSFANAFTQCEIR